MKAMVVMNNISTAMQNGDYDANMPQEKVRNLIWFCNKCCHQLKESQEKHEAENIGLQRSRSHNTYTVGSSIFA